MVLNIALDGPSGAGKSTVAKIIAKKLGIVYLDTGAMYRGAAYYALQRNIDPADAESVKKILPELEMDISYQNGIQSIIICGQDVTPYIREHNISMAASTISKIPEMRIKLVELQRAIAARTDCVLDGRDIGSYVLPNAKYKFYLDAKPEIRAERRFKELKEKGSSLTYEEVLADIIARDYQDTHRDFAPLIVADGAIIIDTGGDGGAERIAEEILSLCK